MCGRYIVNLQPEDFNEDEWGVEVVKFDFSTNFNAAPTQELPVITDDKVLLTKKWGLHPENPPQWWLEKKFKPTNAKSEKIFYGNSMFKKAIREGRCLVPMSGFYEWKGTKGNKQPYLIKFKNNKPMIAAGAGEYWFDQESKKEVNTFTILTTGPNEFMSKIHDRMPVFLDTQEKIDAYLSEDFDQKELKKLFEPVSSDLFEAYPVSKAVNSVKNNSKENLDPVEIDDAIEW